jgi:hypothetical protein
VSKFAISIVSATAVMLWGSGAAFANADVFVGAGIGIVSSTVDYGSNPINASALQVEGFASGAYNFTPILGAQGDLVLNLSRGEIESETKVEGTDIDAALHLFYRDSGTFLLGGLIQAGTSETLYESSYGETYNTFYAALEGQVFLDNFTLYGQLGLLNWQHDEFDDLEFAGHFATIEARYFLSPDFRIEAHLGFAAYELSESEFGGSTINFGASAEYRLTDSPISLFAKYDFYSASLDADDATRTDHRFLVGAKFNFGTGTLIERDRAGASLKPVDTILFTQSLN